MRTNFKLKFNVQSSDLTLTVIIQLLKHVLDKNVYVKHLINYIFQITNFE